MIWTPILRIAAKLTGWLQMKAAKEQLKLAQPKVRRVKVTIVPFLQQTKSSLPLNESKVSQVEQVDYPGLKLNEPLPVEISPKLDLVDGQDANLQQRPIQGTRRSQLCLKEAEKNRAEGMPWLAELNEAMAMINEHQENTNTEQLQKRANKALNHHLDIINKEIG